MLAFSLKRYLPTKLGIITLECGELGFLYVGQKAYNCGIILTEEIMKSGYDKMEENMRPDGMDRRESIKTFYDKLPNPLKPLSFLLYSTKEEYVDFPKQVGALHIILQSIYPTYYYNTPKSQRIRLEFSKAIEAEYELDWNEFFNTSIDYDTLTNPKEEEEKYPIFVIQAQGGIPVNMSGSIPVSAPMSYAAPIMDAPVEYKGDEEGNIEIDDDALADILDIRVVSTNEDLPVNNMPIPNTIFNKSDEVTEDTATGDDEDSMDDIYASLFEGGS